MCPVNHLVEHCFGEHAERWRLFFYMLFKMHGLDWGKAMTIFSTILSRVADFIHLKLSFLSEQTTNQHSIHWKGWMQCMAAGIHNFTVTDNQKNPMQERFVDRSCIEWNFWRDDCIHLFEVYKLIQNIIFNASFAKQHPLFSASIFFSLKCKLKIGVCITGICTDAHYTGKYGITNENAWWAKQGKKQKNFLWGNDSRDSLNFNILAWIVVSCIKASS